MRVHRSHIVNLREVSELLRDDGRLALRLRANGEAIPVTRSSSARLLERQALPADAATLAHQG